jgi:hypothetical protein
VRFALLELGEYRYGSAGIWQSCVEGDFCITPIYDWSGFRALTTVTGEANCSTPSVPSPQDWVLVLLRR